MIAESLYITDSHNNTKIEFDMPPRPYIPRYLNTPNPPDRCELCPLCGLIPKEQRREGKRERYFCLGIYEAEVDEYGDPVLDEDGVQRQSFPRLPSKQIRVSAAERKTKGHPLRRPCDYTWGEWYHADSTHSFSMPRDVYREYRMPFEREEMQKLFPKFKFRFKKKIKQKHDKD